MPLHDTPDTGLPGGRTYLYHALKAPKYMHDVAIIKEYTPDYYKVTTFRTLRCKGIEDDEESRRGLKGAGLNPEKLSNSISRTRAKIYELAACNPWELFVTFTLNQDKRDRFDLPQYSKDLAQMVRDYNKKHGLKIKYLLIPEKHESGAWHMHGFFLGLPLCHLRPFTLSDHLPHKIRKRLQEGVQVYTWQAYARRFGFAEIEAIKNGEAASKYITKYITEDLQKSVTELNAHLYYASQGLRRAEIVAVLPMEKELQNPDYKNDYVAVRNFTTYDDAERAVML